MSEIEIGPSSRFDSIKSHAYWTRVHFDTTLWPSTDGRNDYVKHLKDCIENPTRGFIARKKYITGKPMNYPEYAKRNKKIFDSQDDVSILNKTLKKNVKKMYKKTRYARAYIINSGRISLDSIEKGRRYTQLDKAIILLKRIFHHF